MSFLSSTRQAAATSGIRCYVCLKPIRGEARRDVFLEDDNHGTVPVGPDCLHRVARAGYDGVRSGQGLGPRVFFERAMAEDYASSSASRPQEAHPA
jgi:hypothetical protein